VTRLVSRPASKLFVACFRLEQDGTPVIAKGSDTQLPNQKPDDTLEGHTPGGHVDSLERQAEGRTLDMEMRVGSAVRMPVPRDKLGELTPTSRWPDEHMVGVRVGLHLPLLGTLNGMKRLTRS
jgi:hypothetical protein